MLSVIFGIYSPNYVKTIVYMLQSDEYHSWPYLKWYWRTNDFSRVMKRKKLDKTPIAKLLIAIMATGIIAQLIIGIRVISGSAADNSNLLFGLAIIISYPVVWAHLIVLPTVFGRLFFIKRRNKKLASQTHHILKHHKATVIAVAGSYGKTSMKELLKTVLSEGKKVAATPANKNVITEHAKFARNLSSDEEVIIVELGEEKPGDVTNFAQTIQPNIGVITGLAPAHLDKYKTIQAAGKDIFSLADFLQDKNVYVNGDNEFAKDFIKQDFHTYSHHGVNGWKTSNIKVELDGTRFNLKSGTNSYELHSGLVGRHHVGPLCAAIAIAESLSLSKSQIEAGIAKTKPHEHRMEPKLIAGAHVLDDTYNGTIEGMKAGLSLLGELKANRKIYVTPGLVDQGNQADKVHNQLGKYIAESNPDIVVLMKNSATAAIKSGLESGGYKGDVKVQEDPVTFYTNLDKFVAVGDVVLMQNDWTDNYN